MKDLVTNSNQISLVSGSSSPASSIFYDPSPTEVRLGTEVTWINNDVSMPHTVTSGHIDESPTGVFDSGRINGDCITYKHTFEKAGEY